MKRTMASRHQAPKSMSGSKLRFQNVFFTTLWPHASRTRAYAALSQGACDIMFIKQLAEEDFGLK